MAQVAAAQILVVATPVYRATYTALTKTIFDLQPQGGLAGTVVIPVATGYAPDHRLAIDHGLRPLIASLDGWTTPTGIYATKADIADDGTISENGAGRGARRGRRGSRAGRRPGLTHPVRRSPSGLDGDGVLGAVVGGELGLGLLLVGAARPVTRSDGVALVVGVEELGGQGVAAAVALALLAVEGDAHQSAVLRCAGCGRGARGGRGPGRSTSARVAGSASSKSGMRFIHSSTATVSSMRARLEPRQRWMPRPKATWRLRWRSITNSSASLERLGVAVGGGEGEQHPVALGHGAAADLGVGRRRCGPW